MNFIKAVIMGIVQGLSEFLPISSSGHLVIIDRLFHLGSEAEADVFFDMLLHLGTLVAVFIVFRKTIWELIVCFFSTLKQIFTGKFHFKETTPMQKMLGFLIISILPLFVILPFKDDIENLYNSLLPVGIALIINSIVLFLCDRFKEGKKTSGTMRKRDALVVGIAQAIAVVPGISRSGSTITAGVGMGLKRSEAARYSFILSIPTILAGVLLNAVDSVKKGIDTSLIPQYIVGFIVAAVVGFFAIKLLQYILKSKKFIVFSAYCFVVGVTAVILGILL